MLVTNNTSFMLIAFAWHLRHGYGEDVEIRPGMSKEVNGTCVGDMGGGACYIAIPGAIVCQETEDDKNGFRVLPGKQLNLQLGDTGITVRHYQEGRKI